MMFRSRSLGFGMALTALVLALPGSVMAQTVFPTGVNPGLLTPDATDDKVNQPKLEQPAPEKTEIDVPKAEPSVQIQATTFTVNDITVEGNSLLPAEELNTVTAPYKGKANTLDELQQMVEKVNELYRSKGFLTTQAYIPPQDVTSGTIKIQVSEGSIGDIAVDGNRYYKQWALLRGFEYKPGDKLNIRDLEKSLTRMNNQENFRLRATLSPGANTGETNIRLDVAERQPWQIAPTFDNFGRPFIGTLRWGTEISNQNVTGIGDRLFTKYVGARGTNGVSASYFVPINRLGDELGFTFGYSHVNVDLPIGRQPDIDGAAYSYGVGYYHPFDRERTLVGDIGMSFRRISQYINNDKTDQSDIRAIQTGLTFDKFDRLGRTFARAQMSFGFDWLGADTRFWKTELFATRVVRLPKGNFLLFTNTSQFTPDSLPPAEQYQLGGANSVRGYSEGLLIGDRGYLFRGEHRWPVPGLKYACPWLADRIQGAWFVDFGQVFRDQSSNRYIAAVSSRATNTTLLGAGLGVRFRLTRFLDGFTDFGYGILNRDTQEPYRQPTARVHFGIKSNLLNDKIQPFRSTKNTSQTSINTLPGRSFEAVMKDNLSLQTARLSDMASQGPQPSEEAAQTVNYEGFMGK